MSRFKQMRTVVQTSLVTLAAAALVFSAVLFGIGSLTSSGAQTLTATACTTSPTAPNFSVCGPIVGSGPVLYPGASASTLPLTFYNPLNVPLQVTSLTVTFTNAFPSGCDETALRFTGANSPTIAYSGSQPNVTLTFASPYILIPAGTPGNVVYNASLALGDRGNQDGCKGIALTMHFSATARYTASTTTELTATPMSPAVAGQPVTLSATVSTPTAGATTPVGSVTFWSCTSVTCAAKSALGGAVNVNSSGLATVITTPATTGQYYYEAIYAPTNSTNFLTSTSNVVSRLVNYTNACGASRKINGSFTVGSGQFIFANCSVSGGIMVQSGGALFLRGATVNGGVTSTGAGSLMICGSSVNSAVTATGTAGFVLIGDGGDDGTPACAANTIKGGVTLNNGKGGFEIAGSSITGGVSVTGNIGSGPTTEDALPEIEGNTITGGLACATSNSPALSNGGQKNMVTGTKSDQCSAAGF